MRLRNLRPLVGLLALALLSQQASAQVITGRVVDSFGVGIPGIDIDVLNENGGGGDPDVFNDGTDANGFFTTTVEFAGVFNVRFSPPAPPTAHSLVEELVNVVVVGTTNLGTIALDPAVALTGHVMDPMGLPVANLNLDVVDEVGGGLMITPMDRTDAFGNFSIAVPANAISLRMDTRSVLGSTLAPKELELSPSMNTNLGNITLVQGVTLSGTLQRTTGTPVANADLDLVDSVTGHTAYTPGDNTSATGAFSILVEPGTYDVEICPPPGVLLVAQEFDGLTLFASQSVGVIQLQNGVILTGTVTQGGQPAAGIDIDVAFTATGSTVATCRDQTNASGIYSVVVPTGTLDVSFTADCGGSRLRTDLVSGVVVTGTTVVNGSVPSFPCHQGRRPLPTGP